MRTLAEACGMSGTDCHNVHDAGVQETLEKVEALLKAIEKLLKQIEKNTQP
jgi:lipoate-protein ligase B